MTKTSAILLLTAITLFTNPPREAFARPYDCPDTKTEARNRYACLMTGTIGPKYVNTWGKIRAKIIGPLNKYRANRYNCIVSCNRNGGAPACFKKCDTSALYTPIKTHFRRALPLVRDLENECKRSATAQACEQAEAKPQCSVLLPVIRDYKKKALSAKPTTAQKVVSLVYTMRSMITLLNTRLAVLSQEIKKNKWKCTADEAKLSHEQGTSVSLEQVCMNPQYEHNIGLSALLGYNPDRPSAPAGLPVSVASPRRGKTLGASFPDLYNIHPRLDLIGVTEKYCWSDCKDFLTNNFTYGGAYYARPGSAQVTCNYIKNWAIGDILLIGGDQFRINSLTSCMMSGGAGIELRPVDAQAVIGKVYSRHSCVKNLTRPD